MRSSIARIDAIPIWFCLRACLFMCVISLLWRQKPAVRKMTLWRKTGKPFWFARVVYQKTQADRQAGSGRTIAIFLCSVCCWRCSYQICTSSLKYSAAQIFFSRHVPCIYHQINPRSPGMICWLLSGKHSMSCLFQ